MQPISSRNKNLYKGPSGSKEFNSIRNDLHHDLHSLFTIANEHDTQIRNNMDLLIRENYFLQNRLSVLETELEQAKINLRFKDQGVNRQKDIQSFYLKDNVLSMETKERMTDINTMYGVTTIHSAKNSSKVSQVSSAGIVIVPSSLETALYESSNIRPIDPTTGERDYYLVEGGLSAEAFDQNTNTFWTNYVTYPEDKGVTEIYAILHIKLPIQHLSDVFSNKITINPYPEYSMDVLDIQYKGYGDQWMRLPNYPVEEINGEESPIPFRESSKLIFTFPKREITEIQIHLRQPYWFKNGDERTFVYGFNNINIEHSIYNNEEAEFVTVFDLDGTTKSFQMIREPIVIPSVGSEQNIEGLVSHKLYYDRSLSNESAFGNTILGNVKKVYVKTTLRRVGDTIPVLKEIHLDYDYKDGE